MPYRRIHYTATDSGAAIRLLPSGGECSIDADTAAELRDCCSGLQWRDEIRVVTVTGSDDVFAVGRQSPPAAVVGAPMTARLAWLDAMGAAAAVAALPMPVVAVLNGDAIAHGLELALAADVRIAADTARLGAGQLAYGGFPYDGGTQRLPRLAGPALARELLLTGRTLSAAEALTAGLVNRVAPAAELDNAVAAVIAQIKAAAPIASRFAKEAVANAGELTLAQGLRLEADLSIILHNTADRAEGLRAFAEKRAPRFSGG